MSTSSRCSSVGALLLFLFLLLLLNQSPVNNKRLWTSRVAEINTSSNSYAM